MKKLIAVISLFLFSILFFGCGSDNQESKVETPSVIFVGKIIGKPDFYVSYGHCIVLKVETRRLEKLDVVLTENTVSHLEQYRADSTYLAVGTTVYFRKVIVTNIPEPSSSNAFPQGIPIGIFISAEGMPFSMREDIEKGKIKLVE